MTVYNSTENLLQTIVNSGFLFVFYWSFFFTNTNYKCSHKRYPTLILTELLLWPYGFFFYLHCPLKALWNFKGFMFFLCNALMLLVNTAFCNSNYSSVSFLMESQCINYTTFPLSYVYNYLGVTLQVCMYKSKFLHLKEFKKKNDAPRSIVDF